MEHVHEDGVALVQAFGRGHRVEEETLVTKNRDNNYFLKHSKNLTLHTYVNVTILSHDEITKFGIFYNANTYLHMCTIWQPWTSPWHLKTAPYMDANTYVCTYIHM